MNPSEFARALGLRYPTNIYRYVNGRIPIPAVMRQITEFTNGEVTPNDFVSLERF